MTTAQFVALQRQQRQTIRREVRRLRAEGWHFDARRDALDHLWWLTAASESGGYAVARRADWADAWAHLVMACQANESFPARQTTDVRSA